MSTQLLDKLYNIACISAAVLVCLPFVLDWLIKPIPRWGWNLMTVLIAISFIAVAVLFLWRKSREWDENHGRRPKK